MMRTRRSTLGRTAFLDLRLDRGVPLTITIDAFVDPDRVRSDSVEPAATVNGFITVQYGPPGDLCSVVDRVF